MQTLRMVSAARRGVVVAHVTHEGAVHLQYVDIPLIRLRSRPETWEPVLAAYLPNPGAAARGPILSNRHLDPLESPLFAYFSVDDFVFGSDDKVNATLAEMTEDFDPPPTPWCGPVVILKAQDKGIRDFLDVDSDVVEDVRWFFGHL